MFFDGERARERRVGVSLHLLLTWTLVKWRADMEAPVRMVLTPELRAGTVLSCCISLETVHSTQPSPHLTWDPVAFISNP